MIATIVFYLFALVLLASGALVISVRNPVHSVLFLILAFFNAAGLFLLLGAEFLAMILIVVYVGAVAVLFLFVVMMLDVNVSALREGFLRYMPVGALVGVILLVELGVVFGSWTVPSDPSLVAFPAPPVVEVDNTRALGRILYTDYLYLFQAAGLVLLVAMIGAIVLTLRTRPGVRRQSILRQTTRRRDETIEIVSIPRDGGA